MTRSIEREAGRGRLWTLVACLGAAAHFASFDLARPIATDIRFYLYYAAQTAHGAVPHLDFFSVKTPLAIFSGAGLYRLGEALGIDPLTAIRVGYLALAAAAGVGLFAVHRRLAGGHGLPGILALLAYTGFTLLGVLPSIGNIPKLLMALFAGAAALLAGTRRWILAGAAAVLAFMDWQIGMLALAAVFGAALWDPGRRLRALGESALGALLGAAPFLLYFVAHGALGAAYRQTVTFAFVLGSGSLTWQRFGERLRHLLDVVDRGCDGHEWLFAVAVAGMLVYPFWARRHVRRPTLRLVVALAIYHYGVVGFSLIDFQGYGDLFILLHSMAFFGAVTIIEVYLRTAAAFRRTRWVPETVRRDAAFQAIFLLLMIVVLRPSVLRSQWPLATREAFEGATVADQRAVNQRLLELVGTQKVAFIGPTELLFLAKATNPLPFEVWGGRTYRYYRAAPEESFRDALDRLLRESEPELIVLDRHGGLAGHLRRLPSRMLASDNGAYAVRLVRWKPAPPP